MFFMKTEGGTEKSGNKAVKARKCVNVFERGFLLSALISHKVKLLSVSEEMPTESSPNNLNAKQLPRVLAK